LSNRRSEAVTGHTKKTSSSHRHFLKGGRWRHFPAVRYGTSTPSIR
jgi:hypothetical protein